MSYLSSFATITIEKSNTLGGLIMIQLFAHITYASSVFLRALLPSISIHGWLLLLESL